MNIGKFLIYIGVFLVIVGLFFILFEKFIHIGRLPGDIVYEKDNFKFYFPLGTSIVISIILTILLNLMIILISKR